MTSFTRFFAVLSAAATLLAAGAATANAEWIGNKIAAKRSTWHPWHGMYYHADYGQPVALVVPPTAGNTTEYGWGVGGMRVTPNYHQFSRWYPGAYGGPAPFFAPTPPWPSDTTQFGVHYIRGPW
jgi:hypothetical protein